MHGLTPVILLVSQSSFLAADRLAFAINDCCRICMFTLQRMLGRSRAIHGYDCPECSDVQPAIRILSDEFTVAYLFIKEFDLGESSLLHPAGEGVAGVTGSWRETRVAQYTPAMIAAIRMIAARSEITSRPRRYAVDVVRRDGRAAILNRHVVIPQPNFGVDFRHLAIPPWRLFVHQAIECGLPSLLVKAEGSVLILHADKERYLGLVTHGGINTIHLLASRRSWGNGMPGAIRDRAHERLTGDRVVRQRVRGENGISAVHLLRDDRHAHHVECAETLTHGLGRVLIASGLAQELLAKSLIAVLVRLRGRAQRLHC